MGAISPLHSIHSVAGFCSYVQAIAGMARSYAAPRLTIRVSAACLPSDRGEFVEPQAQGERGAGAERSIPPYSLSPLKLDRQKVAGTLMATGKTGFFECTILGSDGSTRVCGISSKGGIREYAIPRELFFQPGNRVTSRSFIKGFWRNIKAA